MRTRPFLAAVPSLLAAAALLAAPGPISPAPGQDEPRYTGVATFPIGPCGGASLVSKMQADLYVMEIAYQLAARFNELYEIGMIDEQAWIEIAAPTEDLLHQMAFNNSWGGVRTTAGFVNSITVNMPAPSAPVSVQLYDLKTSSLGISSTVGSGGLPGHSQGVDNAIALVQAIQAEYQPLFSRFAPSCLP